ncbi:ESX secretion-associated protein EspG [Nocardia flavorosea]|uniref:ESAT-6 protein secretion system EspG family protein n=1 Tax=Nocardia flavorosea TaxID=53429 RepID=A0A846YB20_9NOCA|nr:ESX secretion-associated protein EspG [Nocardia flavorosea]NKY54964.1 hypothetical protein [Nocardia flavorosea]
MERQWALTGLELVLLWEDLREVSLPAPFTFLSDIDSAVESEREIHSTREHLRQVGDYGLDDVLDVVVKPDLRMILHAWDPRSPEDPSTHIRLHVARRSGRTYLLEQLPGRTVQHSGGFIITETGYLTVADQMVQRLPAREGGRLSEIPLSSRDSPGDDRRRVLVREENDDVGLRRGAELLQLPHSFTGYVEVGQGVTPLGPRYRVWRTFWVFDVIGDGRYVVSPEGFATGADSQKFADRINHAAAEVIAAIKEQRRRL